MDNLSDISIMNFSDYVSSLFDYDTNAQNILRKIGMDDNINLNGYTNIRRAIIKKHQIIIFQ